MANLYTKHLIVGMIYVVHIVKEIKQLNCNWMDCFIRIGSVGYADGFSVNS